MPITPEARTAIAAAWRQSGTDEIPQPESGDSFPTSHMSRRQFLESSARQAASAAASMVFIQEKNHNPYCELTVDEWNKWAEMERKRMTDRGHEDSGFIEYSLFTTALRLVGPYCPPAADLFRSSVMLSPKEAAANIRIDVCQLPHTYWGGWGYRREIELIKEKMEEKQKQGIDLLHMQITAEERRQINEQLEAERLAALQSNNCGNRVAPPKPTATPAPPPVAEQINQQQDTPTASGCLPIPVTLLVAGAAILDWRTQRMVNKDS